MKFYPYNPNTTYTSRNHAPTKGQIGHGSVVKFADNSTGTVTNSNTEKAKVDYGGGHEWFSNDILKVREDAIQ